MHAAAELKQYRLLFFYKLVASLTRKGYRMEEYWQACMRVETLVFHAWW